MQRGFASSATLTLIAGLLLSQATLPVQAQRSSQRIAEPALAAPPLIAAVDAQRPVGLRAASVQVETDGGLARTTLLLTLYNPNDRQLEGTLQFPLQAGQQVSAFALVSSKALLLLAVTATAMRSRMDLLMEMGWRAAVPVVMATLASFGAALGFAVLLL